jgi:hypothetical protein
MNNKWMMFSVLVVPLIAQADVDPVLQGQTDSTMSFCVSKASPKDAEKFKALRSALAGAGSTEMRNSEEYRRAYEATAAELGKLDQAAEECAQLLRPET